MRRTHAIVLTLLFAALTTLPAQAAVPAPTFHPGQMWSIRHSPIRIVIGNIDPAPGGKTAIGISLLNVPCPPIAGCVTTTVSHLAYDAAALAASVDKLLAAHAPLGDDYALRYDHWKALKGPLTTVPVSEVLPQLFKLVPNDPHGVAP